MLINIRIRTLGYMMRVMLKYRAYDPDNNMSPVVLNKYYYELSNVIQKASPSCLDHEDIRERLIQSYQEALALTILDRVLNHELTIDYLRTIKEEFPIRTHDGEIIEPNLIWHECIDTVLACPSVQQIVKRNALRSLANVMIRHKVYNYQTCLSEEQMDEYISDLREVIVRSIPLTLSDTDIINYLESYYKSALATSICNRIRAGILSVAYLYEVKEKCPIRMENGQINTDNKVWHDCVNAVLTAPSITPLLNQYHAI